MGTLKPSFRSKAAHLVSDFTTIILNPISDKPSASGDHSRGRVAGDLDAETDLSDANGPDTSSFGAFLASLLTSSESTSQSNEESEAGSSGPENITSSSAIKGNIVRKSMFTRGKQSVGKVMQKAARISGFRFYKSEQKIENPMTNETAYVELERLPLNGIKQSAPLPDLPDISEPSVLLSEDLRNTLYISLPVQLKDRNWVLLYSTWRHGISLSTLYRRSFLCPGYCLLMMSFGFGSFTKVVDLIERNTSVVGDQKGAVFGGLVEAPFKPTNKKYQGSNISFVFTNFPSGPIIFRSTGANRYFTLCSSDFLALGGGGHFALYLDGDLLTGSSSASETFGNPCLAHSSEFDVKEVELWGFVYTSKYEETLQMCRTEATGICRW